MNFVIIRRMKNIFFLWRNNLLYFLTFLCFSYSSSQDDGKKIKLKIQKKKKKIKGNKI